MCTSFPHLNKRGEYIIWGTPIILDGLHPLFVSRPVSVFLWLCSQQCFGCASTAEKGLTRCVLSETPAPLLGRGSASNPEAIFATICRQINKQIRLITEDILIRLLKQTDFTPRRTLLFTFQCREKKNKLCSHLVLLFI